MSFPPAGFSTVPVPLPPVIALGHHSMPAPDAGPGQFIQQAQTQTQNQPGMPPSDLSDGIGGIDADFGHMDTGGSLCWQADLAQYQAAWNAIEQLADPANAAGSFASIDLRNTIMKTLGIPRKPVDELRSDDAESSKRWAVVAAIANFGASRNPDAAQIDSPSTLITLTNVLAILDARHAPAVAAFLPAVMSLLVLRHLGAGSLYDKAVLARYAAVFQARAADLASADTDNYRTVQNDRSAFLQRSADAQKAHREFAPQRPAADDSRLPAHIQHRLASLADAYRLDMTLAQKTALIDALQEFSGARAEAPDDTAATLRRILAFNETPRTSVSAPPPLGHVLAAIMALGWYDFQDQKCLREGNHVQRALTGHPALPDAICTALRHYLSPKVAQPQAPAMQDAQQPPQPQPPQTIYGELQKALEAEDAPSPALFAQLLEQAIARCGPDLFKRARTDPLAIATISAEVQQCAEAEAKRERVAEAMTTLGAVMRTVIHSGTPAHEAFALDLYRALGQPQAARQRAVQLNRVAASHPELSCDDLQRLTSRFANRMMSFGYLPEDAEALCETALKLRAHWMASALAKTRLEDLHDTALDRVLETSIAAAGSAFPAPFNTGLGELSTTEMMDSLIGNFGFTDQMLAKLSRDLTTYHVHAGVDERAAIDALYRPILAPKDGELGTVAMAQQSQRLIGAIHQKLENQPSGIAEAVPAALGVLTAPAASLEDQLHLLAYFWRSSYPGELSARAIAAQGQLDALKSELCAGPTGQADTGLVAEFNNTVREVLVKALTDRVPGFGTEYVRALEEGSAQSYPQLMQRMGAMVGAWQLQAEVY